MTRTVEATKGLYVKQKEQASDASPPDGSIGLAQLKDEVKFGLVPVGTVIPVMTHLAGVAALPVSGAVSGGWMRADGAAIPVNNTVSGTTPDLTGGRFLYGTSGSGSGANVTSGSTGGNASNSVTLSTAQLPSHTHPSGTLLSDSQNAPHQHTINADLAPHGHPSVTVSGPSTGSAATATAPHGHYTPGGVAADTIGIFSPATTTLANIQQGPNFNFRFSSVGPGGGLLTQSDNAPHGHPSVSVSGTMTGSAAVTNAPHSHGGASVLANATHQHSITGVTGTEGSGTSISILPQYVAAVYIIRVK